MLDSIASVRLSLLVSSSPYSSPARIRVTDEEVEFMCEQRPLDD